MKPCGRISLIADKGFDNDDFRAELAGTVPGTRGSESTIDAVQLPDRPVAPAAELSSQSWRR
jgi:hypothetical protein